MDDFDEYFNYIPMSFSERAQIIAKVEEETKIMYGYANMGSKEYRQNLPFDKKEEMLAFMFKRGSFYQQQLGL